MQILRQINILEYDKAFPGVLQTSVGNVVQDACLGD